MKTWTIDSSHSEIGFKVRHLVISTVSGKFETFEGTLEGNPADLSDAVLSFSADTASINTGNTQRDAHLRSADFFDVVGHPKISFISTKIEAVDTDTYKIIGNLTLKDKTKPVTLTAEFGGTQNNLYGQTVTGFEVNGKINRQDFDLSWSAVTEAGGLVVSDEVRLVINVELIKQY